MALQEALYNYDLPTAQELPETPPEKLAWMVKVRRHVNEHWKKTILQEAEKQNKNKSTLEFLSIASYTPGKVHPIWTNCKHNSNSLLKAYAQVKLSSGSYILRSIRAKFNQYQVSKLCTLCRELDETLQHFILHCVTLQSIRQSFINALYELVGSTNDEELLRLILDPSTTCAHSGNSDEPWLTRIYSLTRGLSCLLAYSQFVCCVMDFLTCVTCYNCR